MQLNDQDKFNLSRAPATTSRALRLKELCIMFRTDEISEADILQECETVRQQLYDAHTSASEVQDARYQISTTKRCHNR